MERILTRTVEEDEARLQTAELRQSARVGQIAAHHRRHVEALEREGSIGIQRSSSYADCGDFRRVAHTPTAAVIEGSPSPLATSASAANLPHSLGCGAALSSAGILAALVNGRDSRLKGPAAARREGLGGLVLPRHALLCPGDRGGSTRGVATAVPDDVACCSTARSCTQSHHPLSSSALTPAPTRRSPGKRTLSPLRVPLPTSPLELPRTPSPQRASAGFRLAAERGFSLCEPIDNLGRCSTGLPIHGSHPVHHIERVLAATGTASHAVIAMLAAPTLSSGSPTGANPPSPFPKAEQWLRQKLAATPARHASAEGGGHSERRGEDAGCVDGQSGGDSAPAPSGTHGAWPPAGAHHATVPPAEGTRRSANGWPGSLTDSAFSMVALLEGLSPSPKRPAAK